MNIKLEKFKDSLKEIFGTKYPQVEKGLKQIQPTTFRINTLKQVNEQKVIEKLKEQGFNVQKGPLENSYLIKSNSGYISDTEEFKFGKIYVQELSSMIPPLVLDPQPGEKIMDMAAAPGSKTTQMAALTENRSEILALEKHPIRIKTLRHNVELQSAENVQVLQGNGIKFDRRNPQFTEFFDRVLVDAPCSTEGNINLNNPKSYKYWNIHKRKDMSRIQKGLIMSGIRMLKPGGTLVYSTCTYGMEENELVLEWLLEKIPELKIEKIDLDIQNKVPGIRKWNNKELNPQIKNSVRILPNELFTGFFIAKIRKPDAILET